ncbi:MAG: protein kinase, partial [Anaerolineae bacterium]|nr:protein kinase [Phycisphaerae bacterium]
MSQTRLAVLLFTDIVGSTELKSKIGTAEYAKLLARHNELFETGLRECAGAEIVKHTGDGYFVTLPTASDAVRFALRLQTRMKLETWRPQPIATRVGIHIGEVQLMDMAGRADVLGLSADLAARIMSLATGGQILLTASAFNDARQFVNASPESLQGTPPLKWIAHGLYLFKGSDEPLDVFEVGIEGFSPLTRPSDSEKVKRVVSHDQEPTLGWRPAIGLAIPNRPGWNLDRKLGDGGFGEVWLGVHEKLKYERRVFKFCFDVDRLRSFKRELTLFRLLRDALGERDDIATLYEVQLNEPPFYLESEYTDGGNLLEWSERKSGIDKIPLPVRLELVAQIADAVAAAHSVGVLHKDIKPANILIHERDGKVQPRLADFGIGILSDRAQLQNRAITETGFTVLTHNDSSRTGTRMYSPPESLLNKPFTTQGDVYAVGILLYQMVIGDLRRPLAPGWEREVSDPILRDDISAMVEGDPARRVASALEVAQRIRTLDARRLDQKQRQESHARSHRRRTQVRLATAAAIVLCLISLALAYGFVRERRLKQDILAQKQEADRQRTLAQSRFDDVRKLANTFLFDVHDQIQNLAGATPARQLLVQTGLDYLEKLQAQAGNEPGLLLEIARGYLRIGDVQGGTYSANLGDTKAALASYQRALAILDALHGADPQDINSAHFRLVALASVGDVLMASGDTKGALERYLRVIDLCQKLIESDPSDVTARNAQAVGHYHIGRNQIQTGDFRGALESHRKQQQLFQSLADADPGNVAFQHNLASSHNALGDTLDTIGDKNGALANYRAALGIAERFARADPTNATNQTGMAIALQRVGEMLAALGDLNGARDNYRQFLAIVQTVADADPSDGNAQHRLSASLATVGYFYEQNHEYETALAHYRGALVIAEKIAEANPTNTELQLHLAQCHSRVGDMARVRGDM